MAKPRKTQADRDRESEVADDRAREAFLRRLSELHTLADARTLIGYLPPQGSPGRRYFANFVFFLRNPTIVPGDSTAEERRLYLQFFERLEASGELLPASAPAILSLLRGSVKDDPNA